MNSKAKSLLDLLCSRPSPFAQSFKETVEQKDVAETTTKQNMLIHSYKDSFLATEARVLVLGAGGLGCEVLRGLVMAGVRNVTIIDMDTIELTNLNRQFLFTTHDVGAPKASTAIERITQLRPDLSNGAGRLVGIVGKIEDQPIDFYKQFHLIICGLDSIEARRWINNVVVQISKPTTHGSTNLSADDGQIIPLLDGGTEGFKGHVRVILPGISACFECTMGLFLSSRVVYPLCTLAGIPRLPEHCIEWAALLEWPKGDIGRTGIELDPDNPVHLEWIHKQACLRAEKFGIAGISPLTVQGILKNIVPAVASTNAIIAGLLVQEAIKLLTGMSGYLDNYMLYNGEEKVYGVTASYERDEHCFVCGGTSNH